MRGGIYVIFFVLFLTATTLGQVVVPTPTPTPRPGTRAAVTNQIGADSAAYKRLQSMESMIPKESAKNHPLLDRKTGIYRTPNKEETGVLAVSEPMLLKYTAFLSSQNTGIVKLSAESSCITSADVVAASEKCVNLQMPGGGAAYSFRTQSYRLPRLADIILLDGIFKTGGVFQQVITVDIGDVPIEEITLESKGMQYLVNMVPVSDSNEFKRFEDEIVKGIEADGFIYRKGQPSKQNSTFLLRSVAYRGKYLRTVEGLEYNELDFDKRRDVIVAFRVIDKDAAGNLTIIWKSLKNVESPKLKVIQ